MVEVSKEVSHTSAMYNGHTVVGTTAIPLADSFMTQRGVLLRCPGPSDPVQNTAPVWVGKSSSVTADSAVTGGMPILPGSSIGFPVDDPSGLWVISTVADQDIAWIGV